MNTIQPQKYQRENFQEFKILNQKSSSTKISQEIYKINEQPTNNSIEALQKINSIEDNLSSPYMQQCISGKSVSFKQQQFQNESYQPPFVQIYGAQTGISLGQRKIKKIEKKQEIGINYQLNKQNIYGQRHLSRRHEKQQNPSIVRGREIDERNINAYQSNIVQKQEKFFKKIAQQTEDNIQKKLGYQTVQNGIDEKHSGNTMINSYGQIMLKLNYNNSKSTQRNQMSTATIKNQNIYQQNSKIPPRPKSNFRSNLRRAKIIENLNQQDKIATPNLQQKTGAQSISSNRYQQNQICNVENSIISLNTSINHPETNQNLYDNISPDQRQLYQKKINLESINHKEESVLSIKNLNSIGSDIKAYQSALSAAIQQDQQVLQSIQKNWDEVNKRISQRTNLLQTLQAPNDELSQNQQTIIQQKQGNKDVSQSQQVDLILKNNQMQQFKKSQSNEYNQIGEMIQQIYDKMAKLELDQDIKNQLRNISLQGNQEEVLESLLQTLDASDVKQQSKQIKNPQIQIYETQLSQQYNPVIQTNHSSIDTKSKLKDDIQRLAQIYRYGVSSSSQAYNTQNMITPINQMVPQNIRLNQQNNQQDIRKKYVSLDPYLRVRTIDPKMRAAGKLTYVVDYQGTNINNQQKFYDKKNYDGNKLQQNQKFISQNNMQSHITSQNNLRSTQGSRVRGTKEGHKSVSKRRPDVFNNLINGIGQNTINHFNQNQNRSFEYEISNQNEGANDHKSIESQQKAFNTITQKIKISNNYGKFNGQNQKKIASRQQSRVMSRSTLKINENRSNDPAASTEIASQLLHSNESQSVGRVRPKANNIADSTSIFIGQKNRINLQKTNKNGMPSQVLNKIQLNKVIQNRLYQGEQQNINKSQKNINNQKWTNQKVDKMQPSITLSSQIHNQNADESALVLTHSPKNAQNLNNFINQYNQDNVTQSLADNQYVEYHDICASQIKEFHQKNIHKQQFVIQNRKNLTHQNTLNNQNQQQRAYSVQPVFKNQYKLNLEKEQKNNQLSSLSSGKLNIVKNKIIENQEKQISQNRGLYKQDKQLQSINKQNFIQTGRLRPQKQKNLNQQNKQPINSQTIQPNGLDHNSKGSTNNLKYSGMLDEIGEICDVGRSKYHQQNVLLGLCMSSQGMDNQIVQLNQFGSNKQKDFQIQRKYDKSQTIDQSKDVVQYQQQRTFQNCSQSPDPGVQITSHKARILANDAQGIISDQFSFINGKMRRVQQQNETIDSCNFIIDNRDRKNIQEFLSATNSIVGLDNKYNANIQNNQVEDKNIEIKMTTGSIDLKMQIQQKQEKYEDTQKILLNNNYKREQIHLKQGNNIQQLRFSKASANPLLINDSLLRSHLSAAQSQFYQSDDDNNNYIDQEHIQPNNEHNNIQIVSESIQQFREKLNQRYQSENEIIGSNQNQSNQFIQIIKGEDEDYEHVREDSQSQSDRLSNNQNQNENSKMYNDNSLIFGSPNKNNLQLNTNKLQQKIADQNNNGISSTKKRAVKKLIPFHADDEPIIQENEEISHNTSERGQNIEKQNRNVYIRKHIVIRQNSKEFINQNEWKVKNTVQSTILTDENGKKNIDSNKGNNFDNSKTTICSVNTLNVSNNPNASKTNKSNFLFGSNGNMIASKNVRYSHQNLFALGENGQQSNNVLRKLQMKSVALNINKLNELPIYQKQNQQQAHILQQEDINENLVDDSAILQDRQDQNFQINLQQIDSKYEIQQNNYCEEEQEVKYVKNNKGINLLDLSDQITEQYAEEQDQTSISQSQINSKMTSRKSISNNPEQITPKQQKSNSKLSNINNKDIIICKQSYAQKIELIKSINQSCQNVNINNFNQNDLQSDNAIIEQGEINQLHEKIFEKLNTQRQKESNSNFSNPDDVLIESIQNFSNYNKSESVQQEKNNNKLKNNFVISNSKSKNTSRQISKYDDLNDSSMNINDEDIIHDSGDILAKIKQINNKNSKLDNLEFYRNDNKNSKKSFIDEWPEAGALIQTNRERSDNNLGKSQIHSDDEVSIRRGLEGSMSQRKLQLLEDECKESWNKFGNSQDSVKLKIGTQIQDDETESNKVDDDAISEDINQRDIENSIIVTSQLNFNKKINSNLKIKNAYIQQSID